MKILDFGCGNKKGAGCPYAGDIIGVDIDKISQADVIWDLEKFPYPFKDNEFDAVYSHHCLEHLEDTLKVMEELCRITKPHGRITILVPYGASSFALNNPTHKKFFSVEAIYGIANFIPKVKVLKAEYHYIYTAFPELQSWKGKLLRKMFKPVDWLINSHQNIYGRIGRHFLGDADEVEWELERVK
ncbi:class I SAM-dependent methyltransferase [Candidatus Micrarchaeota archaeon]|nr:class I SAM-dependent methyltransferase [Candidatus Micrarchaeota archaeon]